MGQFDAVMYEPGAGGRALSLLRRASDPAALGLRYGINFHIGWRREGRARVGALAAEPPRCGGARPERLRGPAWPPGGWVGERWGGPREEAPGPTTSTPPAGADSHRRRRDWGGSRAGTLAAEQVQRGGQRLVTSRSVRRRSTGRRSPTSRRFDREC